MICKRCNGSFECNVEDISRCHCSTVSVRKETLHFLKETQWGCLCANCLAEIDRALTSIAGKTFPDPFELKEGLDFYKENGFFVFTERYHMLRGTCCTNGCRHCPYGFQKQI